MLDPIWCGTQLASNVKSARNSLRTSSITLDPRQMASTVAVAMENCRPSGVLDVTRWAKMAYDWYLLTHMQHASRCTVEMNASIYTMSYYVVLNMTVPL